MEVRKVPQINYSMGFNFDSALVDGIIQLNAEYGGLTRITEVFGALSDCPISSARPTKLIQGVSWSEFADQVKRLQQAGIEFDYLMNTAQCLTQTTILKVREYLARLEDVGVCKITAGTPEICLLVKDFSSDFYVAMSITYGIHSLDKLRRAESSGADLVHLNSPYVNRNFKLLRFLVKESSVPCRLIANMSCISECPVITRHYKLFAGSQRLLDTYQDVFCVGCTYIRISNPVEWLQAPWIRPEDIPTYVEEGISHFKLSERLSPTETLLAIAGPYLNLTSPEDLFPLIERHKRKYSPLAATCPSEGRPPMRVSSQAIPDNFIEHFRSGGCKSNNLSCPVCSGIAHRAIHLNPGWDKAAVPQELRELVPRLLRERGGW